MASYRHELSLSVVSAVAIIILLQPLRWRCVDYVIHHERDVREEQTHLCLTRASNNKRDCDA